MPKVVVAVRQMLREHEAIDPDQTLIVNFDRFADSSVNFICRPWARTEDVWSVYWDVTRAVKESGCSCTHECYAMTNILFNPFQYPSLLKEYLRLLLSRRLGAAGKGPLLSRARAGS